MSLKRRVLTIVLLAAFAAGPVAFPQDGGVGNPDDIAALLPEETTLFAEVVRPGKIYQDRLEYVGAFCTKDGKARVLEQIKKAIQEQAHGEELPEKLEKDIEKGFPTVQRVAVAMGRVQQDREPFWAIVASASSEEFFRNLVDDLRVFAAEESSHEEVKVLLIHKLGKHEIPFKFHIAAAGKRLVISSNLGSVTAVLDRAAGKGKGGDLRRNRSYARFAPPSGQEPSVRAFGEMPWLAMGGMFGGRWGSQRAIAQGMDVADAALGFQKFRGAMLEATLKPGKIATTTKVFVDSPCPIYDVIRQPAGPKETLKLMPADIQVMAHLSLKGGSEILADIDKLVQRYQGIEKLSLPRGDAQPGQLEMDWKKGFEQEMGLPIQDVAASIGTEVAFGMVGEDALAGQQQMVGSLLGIVAAADATKAKSVIEKLSAKIGAYETKKEGDATFWVPQREGGEPVFAVQGKMVLIGTQMEVLKKAFKTAADGTGFLKQLPAGVSDASGMISVRNNAIWSLFKLGARGGIKLPDIEKDLDLNALATILFFEDKSELRMTSMDAGLGMVAQTSTILAPLMVVMFSSGMAAMAAPPMVVDPTTGAPSPSKKYEVPKDLPALPPDKLAAEVKKHLSGMKADEVVTRDDSELALKKLGPQAAKILVEELKKETEDEVKRRIVDILAAWKAYDAFPDLLKKKVDGFMAALEKSTAGKGNRFRYNQFPPQWRQQSMPFPYGLEPGWVDTTIVNGLDQRDVLEASQGVRALAERLTGDKVNAPLQRALSAVFAYFECGAAGDLIAAAKLKVEDPEARMFLQMALGWSSDQKAKEALLAGLSDQDVWIRRASFVGLDRTKDKAAIVKLIDLLGDKDAETRWNASYTLRKLTNGHAAVNVYLPDEEQKASIAAARDWWEKNKATYKIGE